MSFISITFINILCLIKGNITVQLKQLPNTGTTDVQMITSNDGPLKVLSPPPVAPRSKPITVCNWSYIIKYNSSYYVYISNNRNIKVCMQEIVTANLWGLYLVCKGDTQRA